MSARASTRFAAGGARVAHARLVGVVILRALEHTLAIVQEGVHSDVVARRALVRVRPGARCARLVTGAASALYPVATRPFHQHELAGGAGGRTRAILEHVRQRRIADEAAHIVEVHLAVVGALIPTVEAGRAEEARAVAADLGTALTLAARLAVGGRRPSLLADAFALGAGAVQATRRHRVAQVGLLHVEVEVERSGDNLGDAHALRRDAKEGGEVARHVVAVEEILGGHLDAEAELDLAHCADLEAGEPPAQRNVDLTLPARVSVRAARVVGRGLAH